MKINFSDPVCAWAGVGDELKALSVELKIFMRETTSFSVKLFCIYFRATFSLSKYKKI